MSKTIAVVNNGSQEITISSMKLGKKEVVSDERVTAWLEDMASGKYALSSVIPADGPKKYQSTALYGGTRKVSSSDLVNGTGLVGTTLAGITSGALAGVVGSTILFHLVNLSDAVEAWAMVGMMVTGVGVFGFSWHIFPWLSQKRHRALWSQLTTMQGKGVHAWLDSRYGIQVDNNVAKIISAHSLVHTSIIEFQDVDGQFWVLRFDESVKGFLVEPKPVEVKQVEAPAGIRQAPVILSVGAGRLDGEAGKLGKHIDLRLAQLSRFALTAEESHGVARAVEDAREAVAGFERLELLGAGKNGLARLAGILGLLDGELDVILQTKIAEEDAALLAHQQRVEERQKNKKVIGV